jgi:hypothetical protein
MMTNVDDGEWLCYEWWGCNSNMFITTQYIYTIMSIHNSFTCTHIQTHAHTHTNEEFCTWVRLREIDKEREREWKRERERERIREWLIGAPFLGCLS